MSSLTNSASLLTHLPPKMKMNYSLKWQTECCWRGCAKLGISLHLSSLISYISHEVNDSRSFESPFSVLFFAIPPSTYTFQLKKWSAWSHLPFAICFLATNILLCSSSTKLFLLKLPKCYGKKPPIICNLPSGVTKLLDRSGILNEF